MTHELKVPEVGESVQEVEVGRWLVKEGEWVEKDAQVAEIETDKASLEVYAPESGIITEILKQQGEAAEAGDLIGRLEASEKPSDDETQSPDGKAAKAQAEDDESDQEEAKEKQQRKEQQQKQRDREEREEADTGDGEKQPPAEPVRPMPAAQRLLAEHNLSPDEVEATGPGGRLLKEDVMRHLDQREAANGEPAKERAPAAPAAAEGGREEEVVPMSLIRRRIGARLVEAQQQAALLTTVNEIDMTEVMQLRKKHRDAFQEKYGVKPGFMSFFVKAVIEALKEFPAVNAEIRDKDIVYRNYYDIGIAIGGGKGLVVPVLRNAERMSFAEIEQTIGDFAERAQQGRIKPDELTGGTFTITNGGVYGSLLSSPIVNPPQSGVLGMHAIQDRPVARGGEVVIRPMMYVALTYDHRVVDGRESVTFLRRIKEIVEEPSRMLLEV